MKRTGKAAKAAMIAHRTKMWDGYCKFGAAVMRHEEDRAANRPTSVHWGRDDSTKWTYLSMYEAACRQCAKYGV